MRNLASTRTVSRVGLLAAALLFTLGCGKDHDVTEKRLRQLQDELTRLQNSSDRLEERLTAVELSRAQSAPVQTASNAAPETLERPPLKVVRLGPEQPKAQPSEPEPSRTPASEPSSGSPSEPPAVEDDGTHTLIRGQGSRLETRVSRRKSAGSAGKRAKVAAPIQNDRTLPTDSRSAHAKPD